jgi:hypothetical protein
VPTEPEVVSSTTLVIQRSPH